MQQFKVSDEGYKKFKKKWLTVALPVMVIVLAVIILVIILSPTDKEVNTLPFTIPFMVIIFGFSLFRSLRKQKKFLLSYSVTISGDGITREQLNTPALSISSIEIREIIKTEKGYFTIKGVNRTDVIHIPYCIDNYTVLEERLRELAPITVNTKDPFFKKYRAFLAIPAFGAILAVYLVTNKIIVCICAILVTALLIWAFYEIRISKNAPENTKRSSWIYFLIIASIVYVTYSKLTGGGNPWTH
jgi:hypothetical protein